MKAPYDRVIIKPVYQNTIGASSIVLTDGQSKQQGDFYGIVIDPGESNKLGLTIGEKVLYQRNEGAEIEVDGEKLVSINSINILALVDTI